MNMTDSVAIDKTMLVTWHKRLLNLVIDIVAMVVLLVLMGLVAGILSIFGFDGPLLWIEQIDGFEDRLITTLLMVIYLFTMEVLTQRTVGKYITGTIVVMEDGSKLTAKAAIIRALCRILWLEAFSFFGDKPRGWHDTMSNTFVVDAKKYKAALNLKNSFEEIGLEQSY